MNTAASQFMCNSTQWH